MGFVYERTDSGLEIAREGADEAAVIRALREHDDDLRLIRGVDEERHCWVWRVYRYRGSEQEAEFVCGHWDQSGAPYPLSMALVERVKELDRNSRGQTIGADEANRRRQERLERQKEADSEDLIADWLPHEGRSALLPRGQSLRQARSRTGYHDAKGRR